MAMEKVGIAKEDLVRELKGEYHQIRERQAREMDKTASPADFNRLEAIKHRIAELEKDE